MGTRHLIGIIDKNGTLKVAQYGQWDGYPSGQGVDVLAFAKDKVLLKELEQRFDIIKFWNDTHELDEYMEAYNKRTPDWSNEPDNRTANDKYWWENTQSRDLGADILSSLINLDTTKLPLEHNNKIYLYNDIEFLKDSLMCEWAYIIDLHTNKLLVLQGFNTNKGKEYQLCITKQEDVDKEFENRTKYYGCTLLKEYDLDNLPSKDEFLEDLEGNEDESEEWYLLYT